MSHIEAISTKGSRPRRRCHCLHKARSDAPVQGTAHLYSGEATGPLQLPGWHYPVVIDQGSLPDAGYGVAGL